MKTKVKILICLFAALLLIFLAGCAAEDPLAPVTPIEGTYEYTTTSRVYEQPSMLTVAYQVEYLSLTIDDGFFFCNTADIEKADEFVNAQRTLLQFLQNSGLETAKLNYYVMDTDDSFSESDKKRAHIALSHTKGYQQVLITLQTLWGDYTDYGYLHAVANAIAAHLGWQTDAVEEVEQAALNTFFAENPDALNLLYPCFTTIYASEETVWNCEALSKQLLEKIDLREALAKPIDEQLSDFHTLVDAYAQEISVTFSRQESGYAYYGEYIPLKISTTYVLHFIDRDYEDYYLTEMEELGDDSWDYFSDYQSIFETLDTINEEITRSVSHFGLEDEVGIVDMYWLSTESSVARFNKPDYAYYYMQYENAPFDGTIHLTMLDAYLHEYFHHIDAVLSGWLYQTWQEQAFADLGDTQSQYARHVFEWPLLHDEQFQEIFQYIYGREYQGGIDDNYDAYDLFCYGYTSYEFDYEFGRNEWKSLTHYLLDLYGEDTVTKMFLFSENVETITGKTWEELRDDWQQHINKKLEKLLEFLTDSTDSE